MNEFFVTYMALWGTACFIAALFMFKFRHVLDLFKRPYWLGLFQGWKVITFIVATFGINVIAPYTGDPTWDYVDATFMSVLAFTTAPWAVGVLYQALKGNRSLVQVYIAACVWMFSVSWSYDLYLVIRDGYYPITWFANIFASSLLYLCAGLFWSLEYVEGRGVIFGFMELSWPSIESKGKVNQIIWYALPFMVLVTAMLVPFLVGHINW